MGLACVFLVSGQMKLGHEKLFLNKDRIYLLGGVANDPQWEIRTRTKFCVNLHR